MNATKSILIIVVILLLGVLAFYGLNSLNNPPTSSPTPTSTPTPQALTTEGKIISVSDDSKRVTILSQDGKELNLTVADATKILDDNDNQINFLFFPKGSSIRVKGEILGSNFSSVSEIKILKMPNIIVFAPKSNDEIGLPLVIDGAARVFESTFAYRLKDSNGAILVENSAMANAPDAGQFGLFHVEASYPEPKGTIGTVEVFEYSAKDGSEINKVIVPVRFKKVESMTVKAFFGNTVKNPGAEDCKAVFPVDRRIPKTQAVARAALEELLKGVNAEEGKAGYFTSINSGVKINSIVVESGVAKVDFDETLEQAVGGSCRVAAIRAQITQTLKQFSTVKSVIISINGRTEDILQP